MSGAGARQAAAGQGLRQAGALARIDGRHLARSPLLWLGVGLGAALLALELRLVWPALAGDDLVAHRAGVAVAAGALLAGAWLGQRDRATGVADLVAVTPTVAWRLWGARLGGVAVVAAAASAALFAAGLVDSAARGGRGTPDLRLLADGALGAVLAGWVGLVVGRRFRARLVPLLAAPAWIAVSFLGPTVLGEQDASLQRLALQLAWEERSAAFGFLPDPLWPHLGYLLGLVAVAGVGFLVLAARPGPRGRPLAALLLVGVAGLVLAVACAARLVALPDRLVVVGPTDLRPVSLADLHAHEPLPPYPDDGRASSCAGDPALTVCVYPAYGRGLAGYVHRAAAPEARLLAGLPGVPHRVRMVPTTSVAMDPPCLDGDVALHEWMARGLGRGRTTRILLSELYLRCALGQAGGHDAVDDTRDAVRLWAMVATGELTPEEVRSAAVGGPGPLVPIFPPSPAAAEAGLAMAALPPGRVRQELGPRWQRLRAGDLPLSELPGERP